MPGEKNEVVGVSAPGRLHLGFLDLHGGMDRLFGSLGLGLRGISTDIEARFAERLLVSGPGAGRAHRYAERLLAHVNIRQGLRIHINHAIPEHAGLGSGTQMALAVGTAINTLFQLDLSPGKIARILGRGNRSGIGIGAFSEGGFIVDGGRCPATEIPPIISRLHFPDSWRFVLVFDERYQGVHGQQEKQAFGKLDKMAEQESAELCRLLVMQVLPAIVEQNCGAFGEAISQIQLSMGEYFKTEQSGIYASADVGETLAYLHGQGASGIGQSSWGPTGFAIFASETDAYQVVKNLRKHWRWKPSLNLMICQAKNEGARIELHSASEQGRASLDSRV